MTDIKVPKNIKKVELYDHLDSIRIKTLDKSKAKYQNQLEPVKEDLISFLSHQIVLAENARLAIQATNFKLIYAMSTNYRHNDLSKIAFELKSSTGHDIRKSINYNLIALRKFNETHPKFVGTAIVPILEKWNDIVTKYEKEKSDGLTLYNELTRVVKAQKKASKAFQVLVEMGLDMSKFEPEIPNLPALVKTSVDINIFNSED